MLHVASLDGTRYIARVGLRMACRKEFAMHQEHSQVAMACAVSAVGLDPGDIGVVVHVHAGGAAYEVEFMRVDGRTIGVQTFEACQVRPARSTASSSRLV